MEANIGHSISLKNAPEILQHKQEKWLLLCIMIIKAGFCFLVASKGKLHPTFPSCVIPQVLVNYCFLQYALMNFKGYLSAVSLYSRSYNSISHII